MEKETKVLNALSARFAGLGELGTVPVDRRIYLEVPSEQFMSVIEYACNELKYRHLCTITGLDTGDALEMIYHISNDDDGIMLNLKKKISKEFPEIPSVIPLYNGAVFYERELEGMLGVKVNGLPEGRQYPLPDGWPKGQYPLRKDWTPDQLKTEEAK